MADREALLEQLYAAHRQDMVRVARAICPSEADAEDAVAEALLALVRHGDTLQGLQPAAQRAYVAAAVRHAALDSWRRRKRENQRQVPLMEELAAEDTAEDALLRGEQLAQVRDALLRLPEKERLALQLKLSQGLSDPAVADILGVKPATVRKLVERGRRHLRQYLEEVNP